MLNRNKVIAVACIAALVAVGIRIWFAFGLAASPLFAPLEGGHDRTLYHLAAQGPLWPDGAFEYLPLYPMLLKLVYLVSGPHLWGAASFGILCDTLTSALIVLIAHRLRAPLALSFFCTLIYALYPLAIVYSTITMPNTLNALLATAIVYAALVIPKRRLFAWAGLGFLIGVAALGWAAWLLIAMALAAFWLLARPPQGPSPMGTLALIVGFVLPLIPFGIHNTRAEGSFTLLTTHGGFNFYMGNNERATGYPVRIRDFRMTARAMLEDAHRAAEEATGHALSHAESSAWWSAQGRQFWREHLGMAIKLSARKFLLFWNRTDVDDLRMVEQSRLLTGWFTSRWWPGFFLIGSLGLIGVFRAQKAGTVRTVILAGMGGLVLYFITARYRLTLAPLLLAIGAAGVTVVWNERALKKRTALNVAALLAAMTCVAWPVSIRDVRAVDYYNAAVQLLQADKTEAAIQTARSGLEIDPQSADLYHALGSGLYRVTNYLEAAEAFARCAELDPAHPQAFYNLGLSLARAEQYCEAAEILARASRMRTLPANALALAAELERFCAEAQQGEKNAAAPTEQ